MMPSVILEKMPSPYVWSAGGARTAPCNTVTTISPNIIISHPPMNCSSIFSSRAPRAIVKNTCRSPVHVPVLAGSNMADKFPSARPVTNLCIRAGCTTMRPNLHHFCSMSWPSRSLKTGLTIMSFTKLKWQRGAGLQYTGLFSGRPANGVGRIKKALYWRRHARLLQSSQLLLADAVNSIGRQFVSVTAMALSSVVDRTWDARWGLTLAHLLAVSLGLLALLAFRLLATLWRSWLPLLRPQRGVQPAARTAGGGRPGPGRRHVAAQAAPATNGVAGRWNPGGLLFAMALPPPHFMKSIGNPFRQTRCSAQQELDQPVQQTPRMKLKFLRAPAFVPASASGLFKLLLGRGRDPSDLALHDSTNAGAACGMDKDNPSDHQSAVTDAVALHSDSGSPPQQWGPEWTVLADEQSASADGQLGLVAPAGDTCHEEGMRDLSHGSSSGTHGWPLLVDADSTDDSEGALGPMGALHVDAQKDKNLEPGGVRCNAVQEDKKLDRPMAALTHAAAEEEASGSGEVSRVLLEQHDVAPGFETSTEQFHGRSGGSTEGEPGAGLPEDGHLSVSRPVSGELEEHLGPDPPEKSESEPEPKAAAPVPGLVAPEVIPEPEPQPQPQSQPQPQPEHEPHWGAFQELVLEIDLHEQLFGSSRVAWPQVKEVHLRYLRGAMNDFQRFAAGAAAEYRQEITRAGKVYWAEAIQASRTCADLSWGDSALLSPKTKYRRAMDEAEGRYRQKVKDMREAFRELLDVLRENPYGVGTGCRSASYDDDWDDDGDD